MAPAADCSACTFIIGAVVTRRGSRCSLHKSARGGSVAARAEAPACIRSGRRALQVGARSGNRSDGRKPTVLFRENTNLEWMVLARRKRTRRLPPFLELVCACASSALPVLGELPARRVAATPALLLASRLSRVVCDRTGHHRTASSLCASRAMWRHRPSEGSYNYTSTRGLPRSEEKTASKTENSKALSEFRASLLPIVPIIVWNVKKYGAARAYPPRLKVTSSFLKIVMVWLKLLFHGL